MAQRPGRLSFLVRATVAATFSSSSRTSRCREARPPTSNIAALKPTTDVLAAGRARRACFIGKARCASRPHEAAGRFISLTASMTLRRLHVQSTEARQSRNPETESEQASRRRGAGLHIDQGGVDAGWFSQKEAMTRILDRQARPGRRSSSSVCPADARFPPDILKP